MSFFDYRTSAQMGEASFYALIMAAYRRADSKNAALIQAAWPDVVTEVRERYNLPGGMYPHEQATHV